MQRSAILPNLTILRHWESLLPEGLNFLRQHGGKCDFSLHAIFLQYLSKNLWGGAEAVCSCYRAARYMVLQRVQERISAMRRIENAARGIMPERTADIFPDERNIVWKI